MPKGYFMIKTRSFRKLGKVAEVLAETSYSRTSIKMSKVHVFISTPSERDIDHVLDDIGNIVGANNADFYEK